MSKKQSVLERCEPCVWFGKLCDGSCSKKSEPQAEAAVPLTDHRCRNDVSACKRKVCAVECQYAHLAAAVPSQRQEAAQVEHKFGCDALGGYGHGVGPCSCGAVPPAAAQVEVGSIHRAHLEPRPEPWCREILLYSPSNAGDSPENRVRLYSLVTPPPILPVAVPVPHALDAYNKAVEFIQNSQKDEAKRNGDPDFVPPLPADWIVLAVMTAYSRGHLHGGIKERNRSVSASSTWPDCPMCGDNDKTYRTSEGKLRCGRCHD